MQKDFSKRYRIEYKFLCFYLAGLSLIGASIFQLMKGL